MNAQKQIALITGGSRGLGRNTALNLAKRCIDSIITYQCSQESALYRRDHRVKMTNFPQAITLHMGRSRSDPQARDSAALA